MLEEVGMVVAGLDFPIALDSVHNTRVSGRQFWPPQIVFDAEFPCLPAGPEGLHGNLREGSRTAERGKGPNRGTKGGVT